MSRPIPLARVFLFASVLGAGMVRAQNLEQSFYSSLYPTDGSFQTSIDFPQFDPALGTLVEARIAVTPHFGCVLRAENTDTFSPQTVTLLFAGTVTVSRAGHMLAAGTSSGYVSHYLFPFDGIVDFTGTSGMNESLHDDLETNVTILPSSPEFAGFLGQPGSTKPMHLDVEAALDPECDPFGNPLIVFDSRSTTASEITVTYVYSASGAPFCPGDGTGTACPCSNSGAAGHGCSSPSVPNGALLSGSGDASVANDTLTLTVTDLPQSTMMVLMQSDGSSMSGTPFGAGLRCTAGTTIRIKTIAVGTTALIGAGNGATSVSIAGGIPATGATRFYQAAFRESPGACNGAPINFSNGWRVSWRP